MMPAALNSSVASYSFAFDVAPNRSVYAYGFGSTITTYSYTSGNVTPTATCILPDALLVLNDLRFSVDSASIFATVRSSDTTYRCNVRCPLGVYVLSQSKLVCASEAASAADWLSSSSVVQCVAWMPDTYSTPMVPEAGRFVQGQCSACRSPLAFEYDDLIYWLVHPSCIVE